MSSSVANAQHLQKMDLHLGESDVNFLQSILPCLASSQSLQELAVRCDASGVFSWCVAQTQYIHSHTHMLAHWKCIVFCLTGVCVWCNVFSEFGFLSLSVVGCIGEVC